MPLNDPAPAVDITVGTSDFRAALIAVRPHVSTGDDSPVLTRIRLNVRPDGNVYVYATDRYTIGIGLVSVWDDAYHDPDPQQFDLTVEDAAKILAVFKPDKDADGDSKVGLVSDGKTLTVTDQSGLFPDAEQQLVLPLLPPSDYPDVLRLVARIARNATTGEVPESPHIQLAPVLVNRFKAAATAYGEPYVFSQSGEARTALMCRIGESFLGALMPQRMDDAALASFEADMRAWRQRLPEPADEPVAMPEPVDLAEFAADEA
jgi:hypothetical protein